MAELLIKAKEPWNNDADVSKMSEIELKEFNYRSRKGDIIIVRPDGWKWGECECLPDFIVVKTKDSYEEAKKYEEGLLQEVEKYDDEKKETVTEKEVAKRRKYNIEVSAVDSVAEEVKTFIKITAVELKAEIKEKVIGNATQKDS